MKKEINIKQVDQESSSSKSEEFGFARAEKGAAFCE